MSAEELRHNDDDGEDEEARPSGRVQEDDDLDEVNLDVDEGEDDDVMLAVPTKRHPQQLDGFFTRIGGAAMASTICQRCKEKEVVEVLTVSAPFEDLVERTLSLNYCKACSDYTVSRRQKAAAEGAIAAAIEKPIQASAPLFGMALDPNDTPSDEQLEALFAAASVSKTTAKTKSKSPASAKTPRTKSFLYEFVYEPSDEHDEALDHAKALLERYNREAREQGEDTFEAKPVLGGERAAADADSFIERIQREPRQRVRYYSHGKGLVPNAETQAKARVPRSCSACGGRRMLEFQVMPQAITDIEQVLGFELDFSTILVFACAKSCDEGQAEECLVCPSF